MEPIPSFRARHLRPYLAFLKEIGAPVERELRRAKLPTMLPDGVDAYLPQLPALNFLKAMSKSEGIDALGLRVLQRLQLTDFSEPFVAAARRSPTLQAALERFRELVFLEDAHLRIWIVAGETTVKVCSRYRFPLDREDLRHEESNQLMALTAIVRGLTEPGWHPGEMAFSSHFPLPRFASERFPNTRLLVGQEINWITVPRNLLSLPPCIKADPGRSQTGAGAATLANPVESEPDLAGSLKAVLSAYLPEHVPPIEVAAEMASISVRTLQRRLKATGLTYIDLIGEVRYAAATRLLQETDATVLEIALELGYEDPSHFARAFRRLAGVSPREFRKQHTMN